MYGVYCIVYTMDTLPFLTFAIADSMVSMSLSLTAFSRFKPQYNNFNRSSASLTVSSIPST